MLQTLVIIAFLPILLQNLGLLGELKINLNMVKYFFLFNQMLIWLIIVNTEQRKKDIKYLLKK